MICERERVVERRGTCPLLAHHFFLFFEEVQGLWFLGSIGSGGSRSRSWNIQNLGPVPPYYTLAVLLGVVIFPLILKSGIHTRPAVKWLPGALPYLRGFLLILQKLLKSTLDLVQVRPKRIQVQHSIAIFAGLSPWQHCKLRMRFSVFGVREQKYLYHN